MGVGRNAHSTNHKTVANQFHPHILREKQCSKHRRQLGLLGVLLWTYGPPVWLDRQMGGGKLCVRGSVLCQCCVSISGSARSDVVVLPQCSRIHPKFYGQSREFWMHSTVTQWHHLKFASKMTLQCQSDANQVGPTSHNLPTPGTYETDYWCPALVDISCPRSVYLKGRPSQKAVSCSHDQI